MGALDGARCLPSRSRRNPAAPLPESSRDPNTAISRLDREIDLLREYRTRLVADVVTGKLDVREAAVRLPEEDAPDSAADTSEEADDIEAAEEVAE